MLKTCVIIPTYNEEENIGNLVRALLTLPLGLDVLVVDDGNDKTTEIVTAISQTDPRVSVLRRGEKGGRGSAVMAGLRHCLEKGYERFVEMDADFSHDPKELESLLAVSAPRVVVIGSRYLPTSRIIGWPWKRTIFSKAANLFARPWLRIPIHDFTNGYRVYDREAAALLVTAPIKSKGYIVLSEIAYLLKKHGFRFVEVPTVFVNRTRGASNFNLSEIQDALFGILRIPFHHR